MLPFSIDAIVTLSSRMVIVPNVTLFHDKKGKKSPACNSLTFHVPQDFSQSHRPFWMMTSDHRVLLEIITGRESWQTTCSLFWSWWILKHEWTRKLGISWFIWTHCLTLLSTAIWTNWYFLLCIMFPFKRTVYKISGAITFDNGYWKCISFVRGLEIMIPTRRSCK